MNTIEQNHKTRYECRSFILSGQCELEFCYNALVRVCSMIRAYVHIHEPSRWKDCSFSAKGMKHYETFAPTLPPTSWRFLNRHIQSLVVSVAAPIASESVLTSADPWADPITKHIHTTYAHHATLPRKRSGDIQVEPPEEFFGLLKTCRPTAQHVRPIYTEPMSKRQIQSDTYRTKSPQLQLFHQYTPQLANLRLSNWSGQNFGLANCDLAHPSCLQAKKNPCFAKPRSGSGRYWKVTFQKTLWKGKLLILLTGQWLCFKSHTTSHNRYDCSLLLIVLGYDPVLRTILQALTISNNLKLTIKH